MSHVFGKRVTGEAAHAAALALQQRGTTVFGKRVTGLASDELPPGVPAPAPTAEAPAAPAAKPIAHAPSIDDAARVVADANARADDIVARAEAEAREILARAKQAASAAPAPVVVPPAAPAAPAQPPAAPTQTPAPAGDAGTYSAEQVAALVKENPALVTDLLNAEMGRPDGVRRTALRALLKAEQGKGAQGDAEVVAMIGSLLDPAGGQE